MAGICWLWPDQCMFRPKICLDLSYKIFFLRRQGQASFFALCKIIITSVMPMVGAYAQYEHVEPEISVIYKLSGQNQSSP